MFGGESSVATKNKWLNGKRFSENPIGIITKSHITGKMSGDRVTFFLFAFFFDLRVPTSEG
jgi:hypothetical protein